MSVGGTQGRLGNKKAQLSGVFEHRIEVTSKRSTSTGHFVDKKGDPRPVRIARMLSLDAPETMTEVQLAHVVGKGLSVDALDELSGWFSDGGAVTSVIPEATIRRARGANRAFSREHSERIYELSRVFEAALRAYGDDRAMAEDFLSRPHMRLDWERPIDIARLSSAGADAVVAVIEDAQAGGAV